MIFPKGSGDTPSYLFFLGNPSCLPHPSSIPFSSEWEVPGRFLLACSGGQLRFPWAGGLARGTLVVAFVQSPDVLCHLCSTVGLHLVQGGDLSHVF